MLGFLGRYVSCGDAGGEGAWETQVQSYELQCNALQLQRAFNVNNSNFQTRPGHNDD